MANKIGGSFAPALTDELLTKYKTLIDALPDSPVKDGLLKCYTCCDKWWGLPDSTGDGRPHASGKGRIVDLDAPVAQALWEHIPWTQEIDMIQGLFDTIDAGTQRELRNLAFHLLWHVRELDNDREPMTADKL